MIERGHTDLRNIVYSYLADKGDNQTHEFPLYFHYAIEAYREFRKDYGTEITSRQFELPANRRLKMPNDMLLIRKVGVINGDRVQVIIPDNSIALDEITPYKANSSYNPPYIPFYNYFDTRSGVHTNLSIKTTPLNNGVGFFTVDYCERTIIFTSAILDTVYIEYVSTGYSPTTRTQVPEECFDYIKASIAYREAKYNGTLGESSAETQYRKQFMIEELMKIKERRSDLSVANIIHAVNKYTSKAPR